MVDIQGENKPKKFISIRTKLIAVIATIVVCSISILLFSAVRLFEYDKLVYVFDNSLALSKIIASQTQVRLEDLTKSLDLLGSKIRSQKSKSKSESQEALSVLMENNVIAHASVFSYSAKNSIEQPLASMTDNAFLQLYNSSNNELVKRTIKENPIEFESLFMNQSTYLRNISVTGLPPLLMYSQPLLQNKKSKVADMIVILILRAENLGKDFRATSLYTSFLIGKNGDILLQSDSDLLISRPKFDPLDVIQKAFADQSPSGVKKQKDSKGVEKLYAYSKMPDADLLVMSEIPQSQAFLAVSQLIYRSTLIAFFIIGIAIAVAILFSRKLTNALKTLFDANQLVSKGNLDVRVDIKTNDETRILGDSFNQLVEKTQILILETANKATLEQEMHTAKIVQDTFFPRPSEVVRPVAVLGKYIPATTCSGDWWGHIPSGASSDLIFTGDAMGHGVSAALLTSMAYASSMTYSDTKSRQKESLTPSQVLESINRTLYSAVQGKFSMTMVIAQIDSAKSKILVASAGHNFPFLVKAGSKVLSVAAQGSPLGLVENETYKDEEFDFVAGDRFVAFTDGLIECTNPKDIAWGRKNLKAALERAAGLETQDFHTGVLAEAFNFFSEHPLKDDVTLVVAEIKK